MRPKPYRRSRGPGKLFVKLFVWVVLAIFILTSVGVALVAVRPQ